MFFTKKEFIDSIERDDLRIKNYLETFGFVVIHDLLDSDTLSKLDNEFEKQFEGRISEISISEMILNRLFSKNKKYGFKTILRRLFRPRGILFIGNFFDHSKYFTKIFFSKTFTRYYEYFAGKNWIYYGSDGQKYVRSGFSWHRDWNSRPVTYKMFFKMTSFPQFGGNFLLIPGAHFTSDKYSKNISKSMMWPLPSQDFHDGMSEKKFFNRIKNPRQYFERFSNKLKDVPHVKVNLKKGDALIFNTALPHCLSQGFPDIDIKMMSILFAPNPLENGYGDTAKEDLDYLIDLMVNERNHCKVEPYGPELEAHEIFQEHNHFIDVIENNNSYIGGSLFFNGLKHERKIPFDFYKKIGEHYRSIVSDKIIGRNQNTVFGSYSDEHLGIMTRFMDHEH